jgi:HSP20 family molecular chaperone IbpA
MLEFQDLMTGAPVYRLPDTDVHEENGELILRAEMPGLHLGEVDVTIDDGDLVLDADGWDSSAAGREHYEHVHGRLPLPFGTDPSRVTGRVEDDVLEVRIPLPPLPEGEAWLPGEEIAY